MKIKTFEGTGRQKVRKDKPFTKKEVVDVIVKHPTLNKYLIQKNNNYDYIGFVRGGIEKNETPIIAGIRELKEETGFINVEFLYQMDEFYYYNFFAEAKDINRNLKVYTIVVKLNDLESISIEEDEKNGIELLWVNEDKLKSTFKIDSIKYNVDRLIKYNNRNINLTYEKLLEAQLRYGTTKEDIKNQDEFYKLLSNVVIAPWWEVNIFNNSDLKITKINEKIFNLKNKEVEFSFIQVKQVGAPAIIEEVLSLGVTKCKNLIFIGSVGSLFRF